MLFDENFIRSVGEHPEEGIVAISETVFTALEAYSNNADFTHPEYEILAEGYAFASTVLEAHGLTGGPTPINPSGELAHDCKMLRDYLSSLSATFQADASKRKLERTLQGFRSRYEIALNRTFYYEFSQGDLEKIQHLINELRVQISTCEKLETEHQSRLLKRLEKLQSELHKKISDLDRFWGMIGDAGVVLGKLGNDAKPIVDRIREIADIVWRTQSRTEELSSNMPRPLLSDGSETP